MSVQFDEYRKKSKCCFCGEARSSREVEGIPICSTCLKKLDELRQNKPEAAMYFRGIRYRHANKLVTEEAENYLNGNTRKPQNGEAEKAPAAAMHQESARVPVRSYTGDPKMKWRSYLK